MEMGGNMGWVRVMCGEWTSWVDARVEGGAESNLPRGKLVQSGIEANYSPTGS